jgi:hypothetical protein
MEFMKITDLPKTIPFPMAYGLYGIYLIFAMNYFVLKKIFGKETHIENIFICIILFAICLSQSRNTFLSGLVSITYIFYNHLKINAKLKRILIGFSFFTISLLLVFSSRLSSASVYERLAQFKTALNLFFSKLFFGMGETQVHEIVYLKHNNPIHNYYLNLASTTGLLGLSILIFTIIYIIHLSQKISIDKSDVLFLYKKTIDASLISIFVSLNFFPGESLKIAYIFLGIIVVIINLKKQEKN